MIKHLQRFINKIGNTNYCWEWTATKHPSGYAQFTINGSSVRAHRFAYKEWVGPIPPNKQLDHLCRNRACVNPHHLEPVTCRENVLRGTGIAANNAKKTHCMRGHEFSVENTGIHHGNKRYCRSCERVRHQRRQL